MPNMNIGGGAAAPVKPIKPISEVLGLTSPAPASAPPRPAPAPTPAAAARPTVLPAPVTANQYTDTGLTSNAGPSDVAAAAAQDAASTPQQSQADYLSGDRTYQLALAALQKSLSGYQNDYVDNLSKYDTDYNTGLKNLGYNSDGSWNQNDTNTAYGRSYNNQLNDFGSRDMLSSSFYGDALNNMLRQFNDQKSSIDTARTNYRDDQRSTLNAEEDQITQAKQQALAESIARQAAGVSVQS